MSSDGRAARTRRPHPGDSEPPRWLDNPRNVNRIVYALCGLCVLLLLIDPLFPRHGPFEVEHWSGFYAISAFVACVLAVLAAGLLRKLVMRPEDYYER